jgi:hypothetical protein
MDGKLSATMGDSPGGIGFLYVEILIVVGSGAVSELIGGGAVKAEEEIVAAYAV